MVAQLSLSPTYDKHLHEVRDMLSRTHPEELVFPSHTQQLVTDSFLVARYFGKQHKNVLQKISLLDCSVKFAELNFQLCHKNNELQNNKPQPFYQMTKDGFMFLVMGFTGKKAAMIKEAYIDAFNVMEAELRQREALPENLITNAKLEEIRKDANDCIVLLHFLKMGFNPRKDGGQTLLGQYLDIATSTQEHIKEVCQ